MADILPKKWSSVNHRSGAESPLAKDRRPNPELHRKPMYQSNHLATYLLNACAGEAFAFKQSDLIAL